MQGYLAPRQTSLARINVWSFQLPTQQKWILTKFCSLLLGPYLLTAAPLLPAVCVVSKRHSSGATTFLWLPITFELPHG